MFQAPSFPTSARKTSPTLSNFSDLRRSEGVRQRERQKRTVLRYSTQTLSSALAAATFTVALA